MRLKELGIPVEREWWIDEEGIAYIVDLALPVGDGWLPVSFGDRPGPAEGLRFAAEDEPDVCLREIQGRLRTFKVKPRGIDISVKRERPTLEFRRLRACKLTYKPKPTSQAQISLKNRGGRKSPGTICWAAVIT